MIDFAVIGGGIVGASAAYRLAKSGANVTLVDAALPGQATAAGAGILPPDEHFSRAPQLRPLLKWGRQHYSQLIAELADDSLPVDFYETAGALQIARTTAELEQLLELEQHWCALREEGFAHIGEVCRLNPQQTERVAPVVQRAALGALYARGAARVDGRVLLRRLKAAFTRRGGQWVEGSAALQREGDQIAGVSVGEQHIKAEAYLVSGGCWTGELTRALGIRLPIRPERGQLLCLRLPSPQAGVPTLLGFDFTYAIVYPDGSAVAGATREDTGYDSNSSLAAVHQLCGKALALAPGLSRAALSGVRVGLRPVTVDGAPIVGQLWPLTNTFVAAGHGSYGLELGPGTGALVADLMLRRQPALDLSLLSSRRFLEPGSGRDAATAFVEHQRHGQNCG